LRMVAELTLTVFMSGLHVQNALSVDVYVPSPSVAVIDHAWLHDVTFEDLCRRGGVSVSVRNRRFDTVWPPLEDQDKWHLDTYGQHVQWYYEWWHTTAIPQDGWLVINSDVAIEVIAYRTTSDPCVSATGGGCAVERMRWAGPADVNIDGEIDDMDIEFFFGSLYDWNEDGANDDHDIEDFFAAWLYPTTLPVGEDPVWAAYDTAACG